MGATCSSLANAEASVTATAAAAHAYDASLPMVIIVLLDPAIQAMVDILETSPVLQRALPKVRRLALIETVRRCPTVEEGIEMLLLNLKSSPYIPPAAQTKIAKKLRNQDWSFLQKELRCPASKPSELTNKSALFIKYREMLVCIYSRSRKMQTLPTARRRRIGMAIHSCKNVDQFLDLAMKSLSTSHAFSGPMRDAVANDILDNRFDKLLLPDRFDCKEKARLNAAPRSSAAAAAAPAPELKEDVECAICLGSQPVDTCLPCSHQFCKVCIRGWMQQRQSCPMCRRVYTTGDLRGIGIISAIK